MCSKRRGPRFAAAALAVLGLVLAVANPASRAAAADDVAPAAVPSNPAGRVVSLNPSLTAILVALGAKSALVGVDDYSARQLPAVAALPQVGGLYNPSLEAVAAVRPDLVALVPSVEQRDFLNRLEALNVRVEAFQNHRFDQVLENIERLGVLVGREAEAAQRLAAIRQTRDAVGRVSADRSSPRTLIVLQRDPVFVAGAGSFIHEMLTSAGGTNAAAGFADAYPRVAIEWVVEQSPELIVDMSPDADRPSEYWSRWPSLPAVANGRVLRLDQSVTLPGPGLDVSLEQLAVALHGEGILDEIQQLRDSAGGLAP